MTETRTLLRFTALNGVKPDINSTAVWAEGHGWLLMADLLPMVTSVNAQWDEDGEWTVDTPMGEFTFQSIDIEEDI